MLTFESQGFETFYLLIKNIYKCKLTQGAWKPLDHDVMKVPPRQVKDLEWAAHKPAVQDMLWQCGWTGH